MITDTKTASLEPLLLLEALHPGFEKGRGFMICAFPRDDRPQCRFYQTAKQALEHALGLDREGRHEGIYYTLPVLGAEPKKGRGTETDAAACHAAWADLDALDFPPLEGRVRALLKANGASKKDAKERAWREASADDHAAAKAAALETVADAVAAERLPPYSARVDSGRGWHLYWLLTEPAAGDGLRALKGLNRKIAELVGADRAIDLARVLKVPGTTNRKDPDRPLPAVLVELHAERRHALAELVGRLGATPEALRGDDPVEAAAPRPAARSAPQGAGVAAPVTVPAGATAVPAAWYVFMGRSQKALAAWEGCRTDFKDQSRSGYAMSLAALAVAGAKLRKPDEILAILAAAPSTAGLYAEKPEVCRRTAEKALADAPPDGPPEPGAAEKRLATRILELPPGAATWRYLGFWAQRREVFERVSALAPDEDARNAAAEGRSAAATKRDMDRPVPDDAVCTRLRRAIEALARPEKSEREAKELDLSIVSLTRRTHGEGFGSRTRLVLERNGRRAVLQELRGRDLTDWKRIRAAAAEEGLDLPSFDGAASLWDALVATARETEVVEVAKTEEALPKRILAKTCELLMSRKRGATAKDLERFQVIERDDELLVHGRQLFKAVRAALEEDFSWEDFIPCMEALGYAEQRPQLDDGSRPRVWVFSRWAVAELGIACAPITRVREESSNDTTTTHDSGQEGRNGHG